jgi:NAD(P)H-hydrate epimerase
MTYPILNKNIPYLSTKQMIEVDRSMIGDFGIDTTTGTVHDPAIRATATMTLALPKEGLRAAGIKAQVGELYLADISVPPQLYAEPALGLDVGPIFAESDIVRIW